MNFRANKLNTVKDGDLLPLVTEIISIITPLLTDPAYADYGVTAEQLADIQDSATKFNAQIGQASQQHSGTAIANTNINDVIKLLKGNIHQFDLLIDHYLKTDKDFVAGYHINSATNNIGIHHSGIEGVLTSNGQPIQNGTVVLKNTDRAAATDLYCHYSLTRVNPRDYNVEAVHRALPQKPWFTTSIAAKQKRSISSYNALVVWFKVSLG